MRSPVARSVYLQISLSFLPTPMRSLVTRSKFRPNPSNSPLVIYPVAQQFEAGEEVINYTGLGLRGQLEPQRPDIYTKLRRRKIITFPIPD